MTTRTLIHEDAVKRVYEVKDDSGAVVGTDVEVIPTPETLNEATIRDQARAAMTRNRALIADATVTQAEAVAAVKDHARQLNGIIRLLLNQFDATD